LNLVKVVSVEKVKIIKIINKIYNYCKNIWRYVNLKLNLQRQLE